MTYRDKTREMLEEQVRVLRRDLDSARASNATLEAEVDALKSHMRWSRVRYVIAHAAAVGVPAALVLVIGTAIMRSCEAELPGDAGGVVTDRYHTPAHTTIVCRPVGKTTQCLPVFHPASWSIRVAHDGHERVDAVSEAMYDQTRVGDWVGPPPPGE